jgi:hypothetical protein
VAALITDPDYGISCVWAGCLGALASVHARRSATRARGILIFVVLSVPVAALLTSGFVTQAGTLDLASVEHALAFALGVAVGRRVPAAGRSRAPEGSGVEQCLAPAAPSRTERRVCRPQADQVDTGPGRFRALSLGARR